MQHLRVTSFRRFVVKGKDYPEMKPRGRKNVILGAILWPKESGQWLMNWSCHKIGRLLSCSFIMWPSYCDNVFQILTPIRTRRNHQQLLLMKERSCLQSVKLKDLVNWNATSERVDILHKVCSQGERLSWGWNLVGEWNMFLDSIPLPKESGQLLINWICHKIGRHS